MARRKPFTKEERAHLAQHPYVKRCGEQTITYTPEFKRHALRAYCKEGKDPRTIFAEANFPPRIVPPTLSPGLLRDWRKAAGALGEKADFSDKRGGSRRKKERADVSKMTPQEKIAYYEARIAYVDAENDFLAQARGIKRVPFVYRPGKNSR